MRSAVNKYISALSLAALTGTLLSFNASAQSENTFAPHGSPHALIFTNVNTTFNKDGNSKAFELNRAYFGYEYFFSKKISSRITFDIADPGVGGLKMTAILKFAYVQYKSDNFSARFGVISTDQFTLQEKQWGYRYISKSFQDAYNFGPSADLGAAVEYSPAKIISLDASLLNGEGYKNIQLDSTFKATLGITLKPFKGFQFRGYIDIMDNDFAQTSTSLFAGYTLKNFKTGAEYNMQKNNKMINGHDYSGISIFASIGLAEKFSIFTRYDYLMSSIPEGSTDPWNKSKDGQYFIAGFDYSPVKGVKIAPTYIGYSPYDNSAPFTSRTGLYFEIRF